VKTHADFETQSSHETLAKKWRGLGIQGTEGDGGDGGDGGDAPAKKKMNFNGQPAMSSWLPAWFQWLLVFFDLRQHGISRQTGNSSRTIGLEKDGIHE
jgi:hypothetical protein